MAILTQIGDVMFYMLIFIIAERKYNILKLALPMLSTNDSNRSYISVKLIKPYKK